MLEVDGLHGPESRDEGHDRWLAMQSAYAEYRRASEVLECAFQFTDDSTAGESIRLAMSERVAFERYLEARMEFLEFKFDISNWPGKGPVAPAKHDTEDSGVNSWSAFANRMLLLQILVVILLCTAAFSLIREQKHLRDLEAIRNEPWATLNQTRDGGQLYEKKANELPPQHAVIQQVGHTPTVQKLPADGQRRHQPAPRIQPKQISSKRELIPETKSQRTGTRNYYSFSLASPDQFKGVGPIKVSLRSVDSQRRYVSLSIRSNSMQIDVARLQLNQPVWINVGDSKQPLELVVDRLTRSRLDGHLFEPQNNKSELRAGRFRSTLPASP